MKKSKTTTKIPAYISSWTDKYFHQSAYDIPLKFPSERIIKFFSIFKPNNPVKLYRGINQYNKKTKHIVSWTYKREIASNYIEEGGDVVERIFHPKEILLDTTILTRMQKILLGYDYKVDDREVLVITK
ncbi:MAG: hypothetical protein PHS62_04785 [Patescibacteria group bacterium]|nr:hypothetical protein [Patescibacteria group bacterium]